jgi:NADH-quinone oxidoreductase subunit G
VPAREQPALEEPRPGGAVVLATWRQLVDDGRLQDGQDRYRATARRAVLKASAATLAAAGVEVGDVATIATDLGSASFPTEVADLPDGVVWAPGNNGVHLRGTLGADHGSTVRLLPGGEQA